jgi:hypothetical protein
VSAALPIYHRYFSAQTTQSTLQEAPQPRLHRFLCPQLAGTLLLLLLLLLLLELLVRLEEGQRLC